MTNLITSVITTLLLITLVFSQDDELSNYPEPSFLSQYALDNIYPNPFNPVTNIRYVLPDMAKISLAVYNINGKQVSKLYYGMQTPGYHTINWDASEQSSGIYFVKMVAGKYVSTQKLMLVK